MSKSKKTSILIIVFIFLALMSITAKSRKNDEKRFQMGFGFTASSASVFNFIQSFKMSSGDDFSEFTDDVNGSNLNGAGKQALVTSNTLASMQIGFQMRILAHVFFSELDLIAEPMVNIMTGHGDFIGMFGVGIRCPKWIMPYFSVGINGTFGLYPGNVEDVLSWKQSVFGNVNYVNNNLMITFGAHAKIGLDVKFKRFSVGCYCLYLVKDVINDWTVTLDYYKNLSIANENPDTYGTLCFVASQFRVGASICWYAF